MDATSEHAKEKPQERQNNRWSEFGFTSDGSICVPCLSGKYGEKCGETCTCHDSERCHHKHGCVSDREGKRVSAITSREQIFIAIIILLGLLLLFGVWHKWWNSSINPLKGNARETNIKRHGQLKDEEGIESVYNEIDELAMNTITSRRSFHHSYLDLPNIPSSKLTTKRNTCSTPSSIRSTQLSSKSQAMQQKTRNESKENPNDQHSLEGSECSDVHICSTYFSKLQSIDTMFEHRKSSLPSNATVTGIQDEYYVSKESTYIGFGRSMSYNKLTLTDIRSQAKVINVVDNPIYHKTVNRQPQSATWLSKRKTI
ncbi:unnamed protein product [Mytilus edulis]|uniref:MEGF10_11 n=1 Tax=Mytilus edulis TaxID=6550 RepID=A0A8S3UDK3_MYTED|nr:unnamed protein product [Mytilus edulis]